MTSMNTGVACGGARPRFGSKSPRSETPRGATLRYFYSDPEHRLPIRDAGNKLGSGYKTEPNYERGMDDAFKPCQQSRLARAVRDGVDTVFYITKCNNRSLKDYVGDQFIVGYLKIQEWGTRTIPKRLINQGWVTVGDRGYYQAGRPFTGIRGDMHFVSWEDAIRVKDIFGENLSRPGLQKNAFIDAKLAQRLKRRLDAKPNRLDEFVAETRELDTKRISEGTGLGRMTWHPLPSEPQPLFTAVA